MLEIHYGDGEGGRIFIQIEIQIKIRIGVKNDKFNVSMFSSYSSSISSFVLMFSFFKLWTDLMLYVYILYIYIDFYMYLRSVIFSFKTSVLLMRSSSSLVSYDVSSFNKSGLPLLL